MAEGYRHFQICQYQIERNPMVASFGSSPIHQVVKKFIRQCIIFRSALLVYAISCVHARARATLLVSIIFVAVFFPCSILSFIHNHVASKSGFVDDVV